MKNKNVILLVVVGVVLAAVAWLTSRDKTAPGSNRIGTLLLPELAVNAVDEIEIASTTQTARVSKVDNAWVLPDRYGYPANFETIRRLMLKLTDLKIGQAFNASDSQRQQMQLAPQAATTITLKSEGNPLVELQLGVNREAKTATPLPYGMGGMTDGRYLAIKGDPMVYLVGESLHDAETDVKRWMDTTVLDVSPDSIETITLSNPDDGSFTLAKGEDGKLTFTGEQSDQLFDETKDYSVKGALSYLTMQDIADPKADDQSLGFTTTRTFEAHTTDGTIYHLDVSDPIDDSKERYIRVAVTYDNASLASDAEEEPTETASDTDTTNSTERASSDNGVMKAAAALNTKLAPWTFRIASYKADALTSTLDSLIKKPEPKDDEQASDSQPDNEPATQPENKEEK
jgi:hypothetical protein